MSKKQKVDLEKKMASVDRKLKKLFYEIHTIKNRKDHGVTNLILLEEKLNDLEIKINHLKINQ